MPGTTQDLTDPTGDAASEPGIRSVAFIPDGGFPEAGDERWWVVQGPRWT
jgi:hypothetical protein